MTNKGAAKRFFTPEEDEIIRTDWAAYIDARVIAAKLNRDLGTLRQRILLLGIRRDKNITRMLKWCPEHLKETLKSQGSAAFIKSVKAHEAALVAGEITRSVEGVHRMEARAAEIIARPASERKEKMLALRAIGMTLQEIGDLYKLTRERVRQLTDPAFRPSPPSTTVPSHLKRISKQKENAEAKLRRLDDSIRAVKRDALTAAWDAADNIVRQEFLAHQSGERANK